MFEKLSRAAEKAASGVGTSRRGFLGQLGRAALAAAVAAGGLLASPGRVHAGRPLVSCDKCCRKAANYQLCYNYCSAYGCL